MRQFVSIITGCLLSVRLLVAVDFSPYNTPDAPVWSDVRDKIHRTYRTLVYDAFHARGEQDPERTEEFNKHMLLAIDMATGYSVSEKTVRAVFNRVDVQSRWHPDTMAKWTSAIISDGTTHQRSKLHHKWNAARKAFVTDVVDEKRRYNIILLWPVFTVELRNWYWQPHGVRIEAKRNLIRDLSIVFEQGMQAGDELSPEFLFHLMDDLTPRNFPVEEGNLAAYALEQFGPVLDAAAIEPWVRDGLKGILHNEIAWALRGNGWASDVSKAGWEGFRSNVAQATALFESSYAAQPHPMIAAHAFACARHTNGTVSTQEWQDRALRTCLDNPDVFHAWQNYWLARWGGSHAKLVAAAQACHAADRYDTQLGFRVYALYRAAAMDAYHHHENTSTMLALIADPAVRLMLDEWRDKTIARAEQRGDDEYKNVTATRHALLLYLSGLEHEGLQLLNGIHKPAAKVFKNFRLDRKQLLKNAAALKKQQDDKEQAEADGF